MDKNKAIKEILYQHDPQRATYDGMNEMKSKVESTSGAADFVNGFLKSIKGDKGEKGDKGDKGDQGEKGDTPVKGEDYFTEEDIKAFLDYVTPVKGKHYFTDEEIQNFLKDITPVKGVHYRDGVDGITPDEKKIAEEVIKIIGKPKDGKDAKQLTIKEIVDEIVKGKMIDISQIRNSEQVLKMASNKKKIDTSDLRWHGGGISASSIYVETPSGPINSLNLIYTVTKPITAIINFTINGEFIHPSEYSFSGKTITFITALDSSLSGKSFTIVYV